MRTSRNRPEVCRLGILREDSRRTRPRQVEAEAEKSDEQFLHRRWIEAWARQILDARDLKKLSKFIFRK